MQFVITGYIQSATRTKETGITCECEEAENFPPKEGPEAGLGYKYKTGSKILFSSLMNKMLKPVQMTTEGVRYLWAI